MRGSEDFSQGYANLAPAAGKPAENIVPASYGASAPTVSSVRVNGVESSDLPPPMASESKPIVITKPESSLAPASVPAGEYIWPVQGKVIKRFSGSGANDGILIESADGEPVYASAKGEVVYVGDAIQSLGTMVMVKHAGGNYTSYSHLGRVNVSRYDRVKQGDIVGYVGASGKADAPQLHFSVHDADKKPLDPEKFLPDAVAGLR